MSIENDPSVSVPTKLWHCFNNQDWDGAKVLLSKDFIAYWPQSQEKIKGPENFIELNRRYPGQHKIEVLDHHFEHDRLDRIFKVVTRVFIESKMPDGKEMKLFAIGKIL